MEVYNFNENNILLQKVISESLQYQEKIKDLEIKFKKVNMENGKLIMQNVQLNKQIMTLSDETFKKSEIIEEKEQTILQIRQDNIHFLDIIKKLQEEIYKLSQTCVNTIEKNKILINTNRIMLRQHSEFYELKNKLLGEILELKTQLSIC